MTTNRAERARLILAAGTGVIVGAAVTVAAGKVRRAAHQRLDDIGWFDDIAPVRWRTVLAERDASWSASLANDVDALLSVQFFYPYRGPAANSDSAAI